MKIDTSEVKKWTILNINWSLYKVVDTSHTHTGRGSATYSFKIKNIIDWSSNNVTYKSWTTLETANVTFKNATYLYNAWQSYSFMENDNSEIHEILYETIEEIIPYLKENLDLFLIMHDDNIIWAVLPTTIEYTITETSPWTRWDRATAAKKPATLDNGLKVMVAEHKKNWDTVVVNTITWETK